MTQQFTGFDALVVVFQDPDTRQWTPVGRLSYENDLYTFRYTQGAIAAYEAGRFLPFGVMQDFAGVYRSATLFPLFQNRIMPRSRPEYGAYTRWLLGSPGELSPLEELGRSGGARATDSIQLYPIPGNIDGQYRMSFFVHGVRHLPDSAQEVIAGKSPGSRLFLMQDFQNSKDPDALAVRTEKPLALVGYCPRFLCPDFLKVAQSDPNANIVLAQVNTDAPLQFRYRCELTAAWPEGFSPFDTAMFQVVAESVVS